MKVFDLMKRIKVRNIGIRLCKTAKDAESRLYDNTTIKYWGDLEDMPAEYASYQIISSKVKSDTLFCWCIEDSMKVKDILKSDGYDISNCSEYITFYDYISEFDSIEKNHNHSIKIEDLNGIGECEVIDAVIDGDTANIYVFRDSIRSNIFEETFDEDGLKFREM